MSIVIGNISYLPNDDIVREARISAFTAQINWFNEILPNENIWSICQNYGGYTIPQSAIAVYNDGIGAAAARNILLKSFYNSDYDWLLLCDDDTTSYPYYNYVDFIKDVAYNPEKFSKIDAISAVEAEYHPYKKLNYEDKNNLTHYKFIPRELNSGSATSIIRNVRKYYNMELYYPDVDASKGEGREDMEFLFEWLLKGLNWYTMQTWIRKSLCFNKSSIFGSDTKVRDEIIFKDQNMVCEKYKNYGLKRDINGKINWKVFNDAFNKSEKLLYIKRQQPIEFTENEIPKEKNNNIKKLF